MGERIGILIVAAIGIWILLRTVNQARKQKSSETNENAKNQVELDKYLSGNLPGHEIGRLYERYIGHLYESSGYDVVFNGAVNGYEDQGRDLIVRKGKEIYVVQTKCWAKTKFIHPNHIFQLYGSMTHFKRTENKHDRLVKAVFCTTALYSDAAREAARVLGVELESQELDRKYPMIKCNVNKNGDKIYHLPFDEFYDKVKIETDKGEFYVHTVAEAVAKGFRRARKYRNVS